MCLIFHISNEWAGRKGFLEEAVANIGLVWLKTDINI